jgi:hypothetical protein
LPEVHKLRDCDSEFPIQKARLALFSFHTPRGSFVENEDFFEFRILFLNALSSLVSAVGFDSFLAHLLSDQTVSHKTPKKNRNKWWDGFRSARTGKVIIEDYPRMPMGDCLQHHMNLWGDRYPFTAEIKGSAMVIEPGKFFLIVTSHFPIERCFSSTEDVAALKRRFWEVEMTPDNKKLIEAWQ